MLDDLGFMVWVCFLFGFGCDLESLLGFCVNGFECTLQYLWFKVAWGFFFFVKVVFAWLRCGFVGFVGGWCGGCFLVGFVTLIVSFMCECCVGVLPWALVDVLFAYVNFCCECVCFFGRRGWTRVVLFTLYCYGFAPVF